LQQSEGMVRGKQDLLKLLTQFNSELRLKTWLISQERPRTTPKLLLAWLTKWLRSLRP